MDVFGKLCFVIKNENEGKSHTPESKDNVIGFKKKKKKKKRENFHRLKCRNTLNTYRKVLNLLFVSNQGVDIFTDLGVLIEDPRYFCHYFSLLF